MLSDEIWVLVAENEYTRARVAEARARLRAMLEHGMTPMPQDGRVTHVRVRVSDKPVVR